MSKTYFCLALLAVLIGARVRGEDAVSFAPADVAFFEQEVKPLLEAKCLKCHGAKKKGGLQLSSREAILAGGESGPAVSLGKEASLLLEAVNYESFEMPPTGKLTQDKIDVLTKWVNLGLPWSDELTIGAAEDHGPPQVNEKNKQFWSYRPIKNPPPPRVKNTDWVAQPIDAFVLKGLEEAGLSPAAKATKTVLLRRAYYDLIGLPPTPTEVQAFLEDEADNAFEKVVDRLLESPHYGERWGRHWLDLVRYAESNSYERDGTKPNVWRYRDYVIRSLNDDKAFDRFTLEQLAGDELTEWHADHLIATGYYRLGTWQDEPVDPVQELYEDLDDIVMTTAQVFLGMTMNCARCHDHKIDPLPQRDYYRFMAFFHGLNRYGIRNPQSVATYSLRAIGTAEERARQRQQISAHEKKVARIDDEIASIEALVYDDFIPVEKEEFKFERNKIALVAKRVPTVLSRKKFARYQALKKERKQLNKFKPSAITEALCVTEIGRTPRETFVLLRGNAHAKGEQVQPGFPSILSPPEPEVPAMPPDAQTSGRRTALANWITSRDNPLTARVLANRLWQFHFGRGIVRSANNFGFQGTRPTHPELLDWLATNLVEGGWRLKRMHKLIMLSSTYQMSSAADDKALAQDPTNDLFWRFDMRRLEAEEIRDSILAVNGSLNKQMFGPSIYPTIPAEVLAGQSRPGANWETSTPAEQARRSIYIHIKRSLIVPMIAAFDGADPDATCPVRFVTTQPTQSLGMVNGSFANSQARVFAESLQATAGGDLRSQVKTALALVTQRAPTESEIDRGLAMIRRLRDDHGLNDQQALQQYCLLALNLNEFIYLD